MKLIFAVVAFVVVASMAFDIPEPYVWDESFKVFYESLDEQHKGLFKGIFEICGHPEDKTKVDHLIKIIDDHFRHEEGMMKKANYSDYDNHHKLHLDFESDLKKVASPVPADKCHWAKEWLVNHIKGIDFKYKGKL